jgi:hypothetical protein
MAKNIQPKAANAYQKSLIRARTVTNINQEESAKRTVKILEKAYRELTNLMNLSGPDKVSYSAYASKRAGIESVLRQMTNEYNIATRASLYSTAADVKDIYAGLNEKLAKDVKLPVNWRAAFTTVPGSAVNNVVNRVWNDGLTFSQRIWRMNQRAVEGVNEILTSGIARGQSAVNMSKDLQNYLLDPILEGSAWTTGATKSITGMGTINYNALRLAATEINNSYRESLVVANDRNPIMDGTHWNLSKQHKVPDICDIWATVDFYGKGPGNYPANKTPIDHPGGRCFLTEVIRQAAQWGQPKEEAAMLDLSRETLLAPLMGEQVKESYRTAALKMIESTNKLINQNQRLRAAA